MWTAKVIDVVANSAASGLIIHVQVDNTDEAGVVIESMQETWEYPVSQAPTPDELVAKLKATATKRAKLSAKRDPLLALIGTPIDVPDEPAIFPEDVGTISQTDKALIELKATTKPMAIGFIKANPECSTQDLYDHLLTISSDMAHMAMVMVTIYQGGAYNVGIIAENTWEALRAWIAETPTEIIMAI